MLKHKILRWVRNIGKASEKEANFALFLFALFALLDSFLLFLFLFS